jgi:superfamily II DNA or RNA helicase
MPTPTRSIDSHAAFDERLRGEAAKLLAGGTVRDVRVLQGGTVITGVVGSARVYIRRANSKVEGECSCRERNPCVHVVAVTLAADATAATAPANIRPSAVEPAAARGTAHATPNPTTQQQRLFYLLCRPPSGGGIRISVWIAQIVGGTHDLIAESLHPFALRISQHGTEFPRYVEAADKDILKSLAGREHSTSTAGPTGSWDLTVQNSGELLRQMVTTGRAFWQALRGRPLRITQAPRPVSFSWRVLPNGDQQLCSETGPAVEVFPEFEPPSYIDPSTGEVGSLASSQPILLVRKYWGYTAIPPERIGATNEQLAREDAETAIPRLRTFPVEQQLLSSLGAQLVLSAGPQGTLYYVYNGLPVQADRLNDERAAVRQMMNGVLYEIPRDHDLERRLRGRLAELLPDPTQTREAWLDFMITSVPALQAERWEVRIEPDFPYRLVQPDDWFGDLATDHRQGWFNLRLGVVVEGRQVNLLPVLARYLQTSLAGNQTTLPVHTAVPPGRATPSSQSPGEAATQAAQSTSELDAAAPAPQSSFEPDAAAPAPQSTFEPDAAAPAPQSTFEPDAATRPQPLSGSEAASPAPGPAQEAGCRIRDDWLVRLDDGRYLPIALERIQRIANTLVELFDQNALTRQQTLSLPRSHAGRIAQLSRELHGSRLQTHTPDLRALLEDLESSGGTLQPLDAPPGFGAQLRPYQQEGLGWLQFLRRHRLGGILADDMGLGKTVQTLAHLALEKQQGRLTKPSLIVAPVSTLGNWQHELHRFTPELDVLVLHGSRRRESFSSIGKMDVVITGYPVLQLDSDVFLERDYYLVILDEAQTIKNPKAKVSAIARALRSEHRLALTGTPVENHLGELWSLFDFAQPGLLGGDKQFQSLYRTPIEKESNRARAQALAQRVAPFLLRRTKDAVARDLPPKNEIIETLALDERQRDFYDGIRLASHRHIQEVVRSQGLARSQITILDALLKLRQACCDPRLLPLAAGNEAIPSAKLEWLTDALPELIAAGRRVLLFSQFTSMLRLIEARVTELGIGYCLLTGATRDRPEVIARFQSGTVPLFLISLKAGGTGLNLTAADTVIHYDPWWNPAVEAQATDRAHRIGQDKPVFVYKLIAQDTVEEKIMQLQADKHALASRLYTESGGTPASWTATDIEALFS